MKHLTRGLPMSIVLLLALLVAACGSSTNSRGYGNSSTPTPTANTPTPTPPAAPATVMTATATVKGQSVTILTNARGMTLYYFKPDTPITSACTGGCAHLWPPPPTTGSGNPTNAPPLPRTL